MYRKQWNSEQSIFKLISKSNQFQKFVFCFKEFCFHFVVIFVSETSKRWKQNWSKQTFRKKVNEMKLTQSMKIEKVWRRWLPPKIYTIHKPTIHWLKQQIVSIKYIHRVAPFKWGERMNVNESPHGLKVEIIKCHKLIIRIFNSKLCSFLPIWMILLHSGLKWIYYIEFDICICILSGAIRLINLVWFISL